MRGYLLATVPWSADVPFQFADCVLDPDRRELSRAAAPIAVAPQVFDLLLYLIQNRDRVVSKDDVLDAVWAGRSVSESTLTSHINAVRKAIGDNGDEQHLVRTVPRKGFRFVGAVVDARAPHAEADDARPSDTPQTAPALPDGPSIAVLPFQNLSGDTEQEYFADGVVEDVITALSRMRWLFVIARNSSFTYRGRAIDVKQVGRELGVGYVLEGSVRKAADRIRITTQLIDAATGTHLWAERFEGTLDDIFALQDQIAASVAGAIAPQVELAEIERAKRKPTTSLNAYDCYLRALSHLHQGRREAVEQALPLFHKAMQIDPDFAAAHAMAAWCIFWRKVNGWTDGRPQELAEGARLAQRAVELGRDDAVALTRGGHALAHLAGDFDGGIALLDRAVMLDPNLASAWFLGGYLRVWAGEPDGAIERFERAMRLSPLDPESYRMQAGVAMAHLFAGRFDDATTWAEKAYRNLPSFLMAVATVAAGHALAGRKEPARRAMEQVCELDPNLRVAKVKDWLPIRRPEHLALFADGLRKAGLPA